MSLITVQGDNSKIPGEPEYGKGWKAENNFGCCQTCGKKTPPTCTTRTSRFTRDNRDSSLVTEVVNDYVCPCQNANPVAACSGPVINQDC